MNSAIPDKVLLTILFLSLFVEVSIAQSSLRQDSIVVWRLLSRADLSFDLSKYDSAAHYAGQALDYSRQRKYLSGETWSLIKLNEALLEKDQLGEAMKNINAVYRNGLLLKDSTIVGISILQKGQYHLYNNQIDSAIHYFEKSLSKKLEKVNLSYTGLCYNELGFAWGKKDNEARMMEYCLKGFAVYESINDAVGCAMTLGNIATIYSRLGQKPKAIEYSRKSLVYREKVGDFNKLSLVCSNLSRQYLSINVDSAEKYQRLCEDYAQKSGIEHRIAESYITSAVVANARGNREKALEAELKALQILEASRSDLTLLTNQYMVAAYYAEVLNKDSAMILSYYDKGIQLAQQIKSKYHLQLLHLYKSEYYQSQQKHEQALKNYKKSVLYKDSLAFSEQQRSVAELETKYQTAKKDIEIERLNADRRIKQLEIEKQKAIINGNQLEARQKQNEIDLLHQQGQLQDLKLKQQEEELEKQQLLAKNKEQELQLVQKEKLLNEKQLQNQKQWRNAIIAGAVLLLLLAGIGFSRYQLKKKLEQQKAIQEMRNNIASDLHDDIGASLSNISILNELTRRNSSSPEKVNEYLVKASEDIKQVSEGISDIVWNINPRYDNLEHLFVRMKRYASDILDGRNINYEMHFPEHTGDWKLDMDKRRDLYLLFKEAVNNLAKYSQASYATIKLSMDRDFIKLVVEDNGVGFDAEHTRQGNGLQNMRHRAQLLNGQFHIASSPGKGTSLELEMPV